MMKFIVHYLKYATVHTTGKQAAIEKILGKDINRYRIKTADDGVIIIVPRHKAKAHIRGLYKRIEIEAGE